MKHTALFVIAYLTVPPVLMAQAPPVGRTVTVGVDCLCPGQPIRHYPAGTNCAAICQPAAPAVAPPVTVPGTTNRSATTASPPVAGTPPPSVLIMQSVAPALTGILSSIYANRAAERAAFEAQQAEAARQRWLAQDAARQAIARKDELERKRRQAIVHKALMSELQFLSGGSAGVLDTPLTT